MKANFLNNWWRSVDQPLVVSCFILMIISIILVTTAGSAIANRIGLPESYFITKHLVFVCFSIVILFLVSCLSKKSITIFAIIMMFFSIALLFLLPFYGYEVKGAKRWINLSGFSLQPSELVKPIFAVVTAWILSLKLRIANFPSIPIAFALYLLIATLIIIQPDLGMLVTISAVWGMQLFISGMPFLWIFVILVSSLISISLAYYFLPHVAKRINSFLDPDQYENYQVNKSLLAFKNGGMYGRGPGEGVVKQVLPDSHTDFIFAVAGEEFGAIVCSMIILLFSFIVIRGLIMASRQDDRFSCLAASGLIFQIAVQSIINIGVNLNLLPTKGMTLPFISYGGSSMVTIAISFGMLIAITRRKTDLTKFRLNKFEVTY